MVGPCRGCGEQKDLIECPFAVEIHGDYELICCDDCAGEHAMDI